MPCSIYFNTNLKVPGYDLRDEFERIRLETDLGTDPVVNVKFKNGSCPDVRTRCWLEVSGHYRGRAGAAVEKIQQDQKKEPRPSSASKQKEVVFMQAIIRDDKGTIRFRKNAIVRYLLDKGGLTLNDLATVGFSQADEEQFAQLIGYGLSEFHELDYVSDETALAASAAARKQFAIREDKIIGCRDAGCEIHCGVAREY